MTVSDDVEVTTSVRLDVELSMSDINAISNGQSIDGRWCETKLTIRRSESPIDYLSRTWAEPQFGETPEAHFNRIHGVK